jgi:SAM-dependent methyltransferase
MTSQIEGQTGEHEGHGYASEAWDDETAEWYAEKWGNHPSNAMTVGLASLRPDDVVLDIGCGTGTAVREAAALLPQGQVIGIDPSPAMLRIAAEQTSSTPERERIKFMDGSAESIPLPDRSVTIALAINSIHHWADLRRGLDEVQRVLKPIGRLVITEEALASGKCGHGEKPLSDPKFVAGALEEAGFENVTADIHENSGVRIYFFDASKPPD